MGRQLKLHPDAPSSGPKEINNVAVEDPDNGVASDALFAADPRDEEIDGELVEDPDEEEASDTLFADPQDADLLLEFRVYYFVGDPANVIFVSPSGEEMSTPLKTIGDVVESTIRKAIISHKKTVAR